jgi:hypothetical protein
VTEAGLAPDDPANILIWIKVSILHGAVQVGVDSCSTAKLETL